jgi:hydrogenase maturation protease
VGGRTLVVGLGNPILGDDGVGWHVVDAVEQGIGIRGDVSIERASLGGLALMELLLGFERAVIVDAAHTGRRAVGTVTSQSLADLPDPAAGYTSSAHDTSLATALETGRALGAVLPHDVEVVTVEIPPAFEFSESLSPPVAAAVAAATEHTLTYVRDATRRGSTPGRDGGTHGIP